MTVNKFTDFDHARRLEWIETNGLGGYASGTVSGAHSRRYHGILVAALNPPVDRSVVLSKLDETIYTPDNIFHLSANQFPGAVHPQGYQHVVSFERGTFPAFTYQAGGICLKKTVVAINGENTTIILYEVLRANDEFTFELLPLSSIRDYHSLSRANNYIYRGALFQDGLFRTQHYHNCPELFILIPGSTYTEAPDWYYNFEYSEEQNRGLDCREDLFSHGRFTIPLREGDKLGIIVSLNDPSGRDAFDLVHQEEERREKIQRGFSDHNLKRLAIAADQFVVRRGEDLKTLIAGYHWFSDWGRDTMIALPGVCLVTGRFDDAKRILQAFAKSVSEGMLPNRFPDHGEAPEYNTVDATLWFFHAIHQYFRYTNDSEFIAQMLPFLQEIIDWHYKGTRYNIHVCEDELLFAGADNVQLTWMDAKIGDWVVTPRRGKPVEINALWHNALMVMATLLENQGKQKESLMYYERAGKVSVSFNHQFWNKAQGCLFDVVDGDYKNDDLRPNQIFALSLPFPLVSKDKAKKIFETVTDKLLTSRGLRSLSPDFADYKPHYGGDPWHRDSAYHQGTVWSFLLGPYIDALINLKGTKGKSEARRILDNFFPHLDEGAVGSISEIFDGDEPHTARGCVAQAWGVGEILRVSVEYGLYDEEKKKPKKASMSSI